MVDNLKVDYTPGGAALNSMRVTQVKMFYFYFYAYETISLGRFNNYLSAVIEYLSLNSLSELMNKYLKIISQIIFKSFFNKRFVENA